MEPAQPPIGAPDELLRLTGGRIPFPRTAADRARSGDPRQAVTERYSSFDDYFARYTAAAGELEAAGYLLPEQLAGIEEWAQSARPLFAE